MQKDVGTHTDAPPKRAKPMINMQLSRRLLQPYRAYMRRVNVTENLLAYIPLVINFSLTTDNDLLEKNEKLSD